MMNDTDLYVLIEEAIEKGLKEALNEDLSISKDVEEETEKLANFIKNHFNSIIKQPYSYGLKIKSDEFTYCAFSTINFNVKCEIIYFSNQEEIDNYYKLCNFSEKTSLINFCLYFRCAYLETINDFDENTFKKAISHELTHIYEFLKKKFHFLNEKDKVLYETAVNKIIELNSEKQKLNLNDIKNNSDIQQKMLINAIQLNIANCLYFAFNCECRAYLHEFSLETKDWGSYYDEYYKKTEIYQILMLFEKILQNKEKYGQYIEQTLGIKKEKYFKLINNGYIYLKEKVGKVIGRNFFNYPKDKIY